MLRANPHNERDRRRLMQIQSIADAERIGSAQLLVHVGLIVLGCVVSILLYDNTSFVVIGSLYITCLYLEKRTAAREAERGDTSRYRLVLSLLAGRATLFALLSLSVWMNDGEIYKLTTAALLVAATINIFVFHATYPEVIACVVVPIWLFFAALAGLIGLDYGMATETLAAVIVFFAISPYIYMSLMHASDRWGEYDKTRVALTESQKHDALGKLVSGVAHDFNNVMAITLATAEFLRDARDEEKDALVDEIIAASERGAALSAQLLAFGRSSTLEPAEYDLEMLFDNLDSMLGRVLPQNIALEIGVSPGLPRVFADRYQLETAILNLAINARDAMPNGGVLSIKATHEKKSPAGLFGPKDAAAGSSSICITVADTGRGIPKKIRNQVFDPFFTTKPVGEGSGLGLSMVLGFARQSGGEVSLDSTPGLGTKVRLFLPAAATTAPAPASTDADPQERGQGHVLLVEDEAALRRVLTRKFETHGYVVTSAATGDDAQAMLAGGFEPDALVTDVSMPGTIQGDELAERLRAAMPKVPIVCLSGYPTRPNGQADNPDAPDIVLRKPIRPSELIATVQKLLQRVDT